MLSFISRLHGQAVKTPPFHGGNRGSNPLGVIGRKEDLRLGLYPWTLTLKVNKLDADVAQLAEQLTCNQQVIGSSPIVGFSK